MIDMDMLSNNFFILMEYISPRKEHQPSYTIMQQCEEKTWYCFYCGEVGHSKQTCRHTDTQAVMCYFCGKYGHKEKFCELYSF